MVVEVVLPHHRGALGGQQPAQRIADGGPPGAADVDGAGGVGRDEFEVDVALGQRGGVSVTLGTRDDVADDHVLGRRLDAQVDETRAGHLGRGDARGGRQRLGEPSRQFARVHADLLADLQRQVGGVIAVLRIAGTLHRDRRGQRGRVEVALGQHSGGGGPEQVGEVGGCHGVHPMVWGGQCPNPFLGP